MIIRHPAIPTAQSKIVIAERERTIKALKSDMENADSEKLTHLLISMIEEVPIMEARTTAQIIQKLGLIRFDD